MRVDEIAIFVAVLEAGSFVGAARKLGLPSTTVSAKVAALERRLRVTLIQRTTRRLNATPAGRHYFERCRAALRQLQEAETELAEDAGMPGGTLRITASVDVSQALLPPIVASFCAAFPDVGVDLRVSDRVLDLVAEGLDLAIRVGPLRDSSLVTRLFVTGESGLFASKGYLRRRGTPTVANELDGHDLIGFGRLGGRPLRLVSDETSISIKLAGRLSCDDFHTTRNFVESGLGIGFLPVFIAEAAWRPLVRVLPAYASDVTGLYFAYPAQKFVPLRVRAFIDHAAGAIKVRGMG